MTDAGLRDRVQAAVEAVADPELGEVTIGDMGLVVAVEVDEVLAAARVDIRPALLGCPAVGLVDAQVREAASAAGAAHVVVRIMHSPAWDPTAVSALGRARLAVLGIAVPSADGGVACPYCGAGNVEPRSDVSSAACRSVAWCPACRSAVDVLRGGKSSHRLDQGKVSGHAQL